MFFHFHRLFSRCVQTEGKACLKKSERLHPVQERIITKWVNSPALELNSSMEELYFFICMLISHTHVHNWLFVFTI